MGLVEQEKPIRQQRKSDKTTSKAHLKFVLDGDSAGRDDDGQQRRDVLHSERDTFVSCRKRFIYCK